MILVKRMKKKNNKKSMVLNEFLSLVIAVILLFFISSIFWKYCDIAEKQRYLNSYNNLVEKIENIADSDITEDSTDLLMGDNEKILFFNKDANSIIINRPGSSEGTPAPGALPLETKEFYHIYQKPDVEECKEKNCICLCKSCKSDDKGVIFKNIGNCQGIDADFVVTEMGIVQMREFSGPITVKGGFFLRRMESRLRTVYIEKKNDKIGVCFQKPCIENE